MIKIILLSENQILNNLIASNKQLDLSVIKDESELVKILKEHPQDYLLTIANRLITDASTIKALNSSDVILVSFFKDQAGVEKIKFLEKPFHISKLLAIAEETKRELSKKQFLFKDCLIDLERRFITKSEQEIRLTEIEAKILDFFLSKEQKIHSKSALLLEVWNHKNIDQMTDTGIVEVTINKLKKKLKDLQIDSIVDFN